MARKLVVALAAHMGSNPKLNVTMKKKNACNICSNINEIVLHPWKKEGDHILAQILLGYT
jgi:hypothetical protein